MGNFVLLTAVVVMMVFARTADSMTNSWAVEIQSGGRAAADQLASKHGFINLGQVSSYGGGARPSSVPAPRQTQHFKTSCST